MRTERLDGSREERTYDKIGQLLSIRDKAKDGMVITDFSYTYDLSGNINTDCRWNVRRGREKLSEEEIRFLESRVLLSEEGRKLSDEDVLV